MLRDGHDVWLVAMVAGFAVFVSVPSEVDRSIAQVQLAIGAIAAAAGFWGCTLTYGWRHWRR